MHLVVDDIGNLFILGVELESLYNPLSPCVMVHKYSRQGAQLTLFSSCPASDEPRPVDQSPGQLLSRRENATRAGQLFFYDGLLYHVMFLPRTIRVFESDGRLVRELRLVLPNTNSLVRDGARAKVSHVVILSGGRFLVEWTQVDQTAAGSHEAHYLRIHDVDGKVLNQPLVAPVTPSMLLYADPDDHVYFLGMRAKGQQELIRARLALR